MMIFPSIIEFWQFGMLSQEDETAANEEGIGNMVLLFHQEEHHYVHIVRRLQEMSAAEKCLWEHAPALSPPCAHAMHMERSRSIHMTMCPIRIMYYVSISIVAAWIFLQCLSGCFQDDSKEYEELLNDGGYYLLEENHMNDGACCCCCGGDACCGKCCKGTRENKTAVADGDCCCCCCCSAAEGCCGACQEGCCCCGSAQEPRAIYEAIQII